MLRLQTPSAVTLRSSRPSDTAAIASLHAESWRASYRGALRDEFLDGDILQNRLALWQERLHAPPSHQMVLVAEGAAGGVAEEDKHLLGFACAYGGEDPHWGTLLDNLHVRGPWQGHGLGRRLMFGVRDWMALHCPRQGLYLWVLEQNVSAQAFYRGLGARDAGGDLWVPPGGGTVPRRRYAWTDVAALKGQTREPPNGP